MTEKSPQRENNPKNIPPTSESKMPMSASIDEILRAVKILSDSGGQAPIGKIGTSFGTKPSDKNQFSWALNAAIAFGLIMPHKKQAPYILSEDGTKFTSLEEDQQKILMLTKFLKFEGYKMILVAMKDNDEKTLKKQIITEMWNQSGKKKVLGTRQLYTQTFSSVGSWCGALDDSGQSCKLRPEAEVLLEQILKGEEKSISMPLTSPTPKVPVQSNGKSAPDNIPQFSQLSQTLLVSSCPYCGKTEINVENEQLLNTLSVNNFHTLIIKSTYYCKGCSRSFSRIDQRQVKAAS